MRNLILNLSIIICCLNITVQAQSDRYLHFDGTDDFAELPNASQYFVGASGISMTGWFCSPNLGYGHGYFGFRGPGNGDGQMYVIELNNGILECRYISDTGFNEFVSPIGTVQAGVWQHVAWTFNGNTTNLYINGEFVGSTPSGGTFTATTRSFGIGKSIETPFNFVFGGRIDEVSVWSKGLTQTEIQDMMANELTGTEVDLQLYYKMDQGIPGGNNTGISQLISQVGAGTRDADLVNFTLNGPTSNFNISTEDPGFIFNDYCEGTANAAVITGTPGGTFSFVDPVIDGASIDPLTGTIADGVTGTTYTVQYTTNGTCPITETHDVTVLSSPVISNLVETCSVDQLSYTVTFDITGGDPSTYAVLGAGTVIGNTFTSDPIPTGDTYDFTLSDANACGSDQEDGVLICACPVTAILSTDITICEGTVGEIQITLSGNGPWDIAYEIDGVPQANINTALDVYTLFVTTPGSYQFISAGDMDCTSDLSNSLPISVEVLPAPTASISGNETICDGESVQFEVLLTGEGPWDIVYALNSIDEPMVTVMNSPFNINAIEDGVYTITSISDTQCDGNGSGIATLTVNELPTAIISGDQYFCAGESASIEISLTGTPDYIVNYTIDGTVQTGLNISASGSFDLMTDQAGIYELTGINDANCIGTVLGMITLTEEELPTALLELGSYIICEGSTQPLSIDLTGSPDWIVNYSIDGVAQSPINTSVTPLMVNMSSNGTYELTSVTDAYCGNTVGTEQVSISYHPPISIESSENVEICAGESADIWVEAMGGLGGVYTYDWQTTDLVSSNENSATYAPQNTSMISVTINEECDYDQTFEVPILVNQLPPISVSSLTEMCGEGIITLVNSTPSSFVGDSCLWIIEEDTIDQCTAIDYPFDIGTYDIELQVTSPEGCFNTLLLEDHIEVYPSSVSDFYFLPEEVTTVEPDVSFFNLSTESESYTWHFGGEGISYEFEPEYDFGTRAGLWRVCLTTDNEYGCVDSTCKDLRVKTDLLVSIPNSFTPDNDGVNDYFFPVLYGADANDYQFSIYDRNGILVFDSNDIDERWSGSYRTTIDYYAADALFQWKLRTKAIGSIERKVYTGSVLMIR